MMETKIQDDCINEGFLVINISLPGTTILPKTLEEFHTMRMKSEYPSKPFHMHVKDHLNCDLSENQDNFHTSETPEDYIHTYGNSQDEGSVENTPNIQHDTNEGFSQKPSSSPSHNMSHGFLDTETGNDIDLF